MNTIGAKKRGLLVTLAGVLLTGSVLTTLSLVLLHTQRSWIHSSALVNSLSQAHMSQGLDPTTLYADPTSYDTRPCASAPSDGTCTGKYPVIPPLVKLATAVQNGAGACIDKSSITVESVPLTDFLGTSQTQIATGSLQLTWLPTCQSYIATLWFTYPPTQVSSAYVYVQSMSWLPRVQQTGPVSGGALTLYTGLGNQLYSPLLWSTDPVYAGYNIELKDGTSMTDETCDDVAGVRHDCTSSFTPNG